MSQFYLIKERLKNVGLWVKVVVFICLCFTLIMNILFMIGQDITVNQSGIEQLVSKIRAAKSIVRREEASLKRMLYLLAVTVNQPNNGDLNLHKQKIVTQIKPLLGAYDVDFIIYQDLHNPAASMCINTQGLVTPCVAQKTKVFSIISKVGNGVEFAEVEIVKPELAKSLFNRTIADDQLAFVKAIPVIGFDKTVSGVLVAGTIWDNQSRVIRDTSEQLGTAVALYTGDKLVAADNGGFENLVVDAVMDKEALNPVLNQGQRYFGEVSFAEESFLTVHEPLLGDGKVIGSLMLAMPEAPFVRLKNSFTERIALLGVSMLGLFLLGMYWLYGQISSPLKSLIKATNRLSRGDLTTQVKVTNTPQCWVITNCDTRDCPAYGNDQLRCWFIGGTK